MFELGSHVGLHNKLVTLLVVTSAWCSFLCWVPAEYTRLVYKLQNLHYCVSYHNSESDMCHCTCGLIYGLSSIKSIQKTLFGNTCMEDRILLAVVIMTVLTDLVHNGCVCCWLSFVLNCKSAFCFWCSNFGATLRWKNSWCLIWDSVHPEVTLCSWGNVEIQEFPPPPPHTHTLFFNHPDITSPVTNVPDWAWAVGFTAQHRKSWTLSVSKQSLCFGSVLCNQKTPITEPTTISMWSVSLLTHSTVLYLCLDWIYIWSV